MESQQSESSDGAEFLRRWGELCNRALPGGGSAGAELLALYADPVRRYHNVHHIVDCLRQLEQLAMPGDAGGDALSLAFFFHDAVYDARRGDNEEKSADLAAARLGPFLPPLVLMDIRRLIMATRHSAAPANGAEMLMVDIDLSIVGRPREIFLAYDRAIRVEYRYVSEGDYRAGRARVLRAFLARPRIFHTPRFVERYEAAARVNLSEALARLESQ